ncbi:DUF1998 domain-containing protein [Deinococcus sp. S9]|uniref:DUF1998 domain-containing protein n=1 Tax=Deinococcus sp. S9 TaxID=2545754 RepID=UPI001055D5E7|nr:DUF1998 domain-containing protein [Deinococcus sp. S9]TDE84703.1 hypothetical protein E0686_15715 [Deinococcus sp. S9]
MTKVQELKASSLVLTYGPGALIESIYGPRLLPLPEIGLFESFEPERFEIDAPNLRKLLGNRRIFRIPSNADLKKKPSEAIYKTRAFPYWKLCTQHGYLYKRECPSCKEEGFKKNRRIETIRFVLACPAGHLDEFPWSALVHSKGGKQCANRNLFHWNSGGGALKDVTIKCPSCQSSATLADAYEKENWLCQGRYPEREGLDGIRPVEADEGKCKYGAKIMQRQATSLRIPEVLTAVTIPPAETLEHRLLNRTSIRAAFLATLSFNDYWDEQAEVMIADPPAAVLKKIIDKLPCPAHISPLDQKVLQDSLAKDYKLFLERLKEVYSYKPVDDIKSLLRDEFRALREGAEKGIPLSRLNSRGKSLIEIEKSRVRDIPSPRGDMVFRVAPVSRLHSVTVQRGYRRAVASSTDDQPLGEVVSIDSHHDGSLWLPGYESTGEGIFISLATQDWHPQIGGKDAKTWLDAWHRAEDIPSPLQEYGRDTQHPVFVWWHTLSHLILRTLSVDSGYSLASIRERIYLEVEPDGEKARGGILLYTAGFGADSSLGGLIALVPKFERILNKAIEFAGLCSADPLCTEHTFQPGMHSGAACYACSLVSETSCAHRNLWLDRNVLTGSPR